MVESRSIEFLNSKIIDGTYEMASIINVWEELNRCEFTASVNGVIHWYYLIETLNPATDITSEYYTYETVLQKNRGTLGIPPEDSRILDSIFMLTESCPKENSVEYKTEKTNKIIAMWKEAISNNLFVAPPDIKDGIDIVDIPDANLSSDQLTKKYSVLNWIYKLNARNEIETQIGDDKDIISDVSKRLALLERLVMRLANERFSGVPLEEPFASGYAQLAASYVQAVDNDIFKDRVDYENNIDVFTNLMQKFNKIGEIVNEEYLSKKM